MRCQTIPALLVSAFLYIMIGFGLSCDSGNGKDGRNGGENSRKLWERALAQDIYYSSAALSSDENTVYIGTSTWLTGIHGGPHYFVALDAVTGVIRWQFPLGAGEVRSSPAIAADGSIYFAVEMHDPLSGSATGDFLYKLTSDGDSVWAVEINPLHATLDIGLSAPAIGPDGTVYIGGDSLYAIRPDGSKRWSRGQIFPGMIDMLRNAPAIGPNGTLYLAFHNMPLTAIDPNSGAALWTCDLGINDHCFASPAIGADGTIYVATNPGLLYAVYPTGQIRWTFNIASAGYAGFFRCSPSVGADSTIYFGLNYGSPTSAFFALHPNGTVKWIFEPSDLPDDTPADHFDIYSSPAIGTDSAVYFGQEFGRVYALSTLDGSLKWMEETESGITWSSPAISKNGTLYISDISGRVYAYDTDSQGLDSLAAWPKYRYNNLNTGFKNH